MDGTRCKFTCVSKEPDEDGGYRIGLLAVTNGSAENAAFFKSTPAGELEFQLVNPIAAAQFEPGADYYIDITRAQ